jgi:RNA polymerase-binding transcription factor DksA
MNCINCGEEIPERDKKNWPDYCDKCKNAFKKARNNKKLIEFVGEQR